MSEKENIIVRYARYFESKLIEQNYDHNEIERKLNEWIKKALQYNIEHPELSLKELEDYLSQENLILK